jgi:hypothetical protein
MPCSSGNFSRNFPAADCAGLPLGVRDILVQKKDHRHILRDLVGQKLEVVGQREENPQNEKRQADDCDRKQVPDAELPEVVDSLAAEIFQLLDNQSASFLKSLPL